MNVTHAIGWALIHSLWQGAVIAALLALVLWATPQRAAHARYVASIVALAAVLVMGTLTAAREWRSPTATAHAIASELSLQTQIGNNTGAPKLDEPAATITGVVPTLADRRVEAVSPTDNAEGMAPAALPTVLTSTFYGLGSRALPWIVPAWLFGVALLSLRLLGGWFQSRRYIHLGTQEVSATYLEMLDRLRARLRIARAVRLLKSTVVHVPAVIGWLRPVVLLPASALTGLTPQQIEVLVAHELAHVRRHDYLVNLLQAVVETLLFYHPAIWWISSKVRDAREQSCDDIAVAMCGDARLYARALFDMERLRGVPRLAMAANGGSLAKRIRRLLLPHGARGDAIPRWIPGTIAATVVLLVVNGARVSGTTNYMPDPGAAVQATQDTIIRYPDASASLAERWRWAHSEASRSGFKHYWVAYAVEPAAGLAGRSIYAARGDESYSYGDARWSGNFTIMSDHFDNMRTRGPRLFDLVGGIPDGVALIFGFDGNARLLGGQLASLSMAVDFDGRPVLWLGGATSLESVPIVQQLYGDAGSLRAKGFLTMALGIHGDASLVVPLLIERLQSREADDLRETAVEWLAYHPRTDALAAISRAARSDRSRTVRSEAAEAVGEMDFPPATDSLIVLAQELDDRNARAEAVEGMGEKGDDPRIVQALARIAREDADRDIQREAVETLGETRSPDAQRILRDILHAHPSPEVRDEALETIAESAPSGEVGGFLAEVARTDPHPDLRREAVESLGQSQGEGAVTILVDIAMSDTDPDVQREAVETLGEIGTASAIAALRRIANEHPNRDVRREAIESLAESLNPEEAVVTLSHFARTLTDSDLQREAVESLSEIGHASARDSLIAIAGSLTQPDARREAIEALATALTAGDAVVYLSNIARTDRQVDVQREAVESLGEINHPAARDSLMTLARTLSNPDVRREAIETVGQLVPSDAAADFLGEIARSDGNVDVQREAVETLGEMGSPRALDALLAIVRDHPNPDVRKEAIETVGESMATDRALQVLTEAARTDTNEDVQHEVLETLEELPNGAGIPALIEIARTHPNRAMRVEAIKTLAESDHPQAQEFLERALKGR